MPEKVGKKKRWKTIYGAYARILFSALLGRKAVTFLIAFASDIAYGFVGADAHIGPYSMLCRIVTGRVFRK